eukprot:15456057-Alexandrium_andersonii.AAC.1
MSELFNLYAKLTTAGSARFQASHRADIELAETVQLNYARAAASAAGEYCSKDVDSALGALLAMLTSPAKETKEAYSNALVATHAQLQATSKVIKGTVALDKLVPSSCAGRLDSVLTAYASLVDVLKDSHTWALELADGRAKLTERVGQRFCELLPAKGGVETESILSIGVMSSLDKVRASIVANCRKTLASQLSSLSDFVRGLVAENSEAAFSEQAENPGGEADLVFLAQTSEAILEHYMPWMVAEERAIRISEGCDVDVAIAAHACILFQMAVALSKFQALGGSKDDLKADTDRFLEACKAFRGPYTAAAKSVQGLATGASATCLSNLLAVARGKLGAHSWAAYKRLQGHVAEIAKGIEDLSKDKSLKPMVGASAQSLGEESTAQSLLGVCQSSEAQKLFDSFLAYNDGLTAINCAVHAVQALFTEQDLAERVGPM